MAGVLGGKLSAEHRRKISLSLMGNKRRVGCHTNPLIGKNFKAYKKLKYAWTNMKTRCNRINGSDYKNYGARGITYDKAWKSLASFIGDMYSKLPKYNLDKFTLERIDVNGNYHKDNCKWATRKEQAVNTRRNRFITFRGETKTLGKFAEIFGIKSSTVRQRYYCLKWDIDRLFHSNKKEIQNG